MPAMPLKQQPERPGQTLLRSLQALFVLTLAGCTTQPTHQQHENPVVSHTVDNMAVVMNRITELIGQNEAGDLLVIFDLDNTLLAMTTDLGSDQWYGWQKDLDACDSGKVNELLQVQGALYHAGAMQLTDPAIPAMMTLLHERQIDAMVLTARGHDFRLPTFRELRRQSILFTQLAPASSVPGLFKLGDKNRDVLYEDGVLMVAGQHKGRMLAGLIEKTGMSWPGHVLFVDDKRYNVDNMAETLHEQGIASDVYHFTAEQPRIDRFDDNQVRADWLQVLPALETLEQVYGQHNFDLPESVELDRSNCPKS